MSESAVAELDTPTDTSSTEPESEATAIAAAAKPVTVAPEVTAAQRKATIQDNIDSLTKEQKKLGRTIRVLAAPVEGDSAEDAEIAAEAAKSFVADLAKVDARIKSLTAQLELVDREEQMKSVAAPFLAKLGKTQIKNSHLLPDRVHIVDLDKMESDNKLAAEKALAMINLLVAVRKAGTGLDENIMANLPPLALTRDGDNNVSFTFATKVARAPKADGTEKESGGQRASSKPRRIVTCEVRPDLIGTIVGKATGAAFPSWQAVYLELADEPTRAAMDHQSRNKADWFCRAFKATLEPVDENGNPVSE